MNYRQIAIAFAAVALIPFVPYVAKAATFKPIHKGTALVMTGQIEPGDDDRLAIAWAASQMQSGVYIQRIYLNSLGGHIGTADKIAALIQKHPIDTVVGRTDRCVSACVLVFAAGKRRAVFETSYVGVHSVAQQLTNNYGDTEMKENGIALMTTVFLARRLARMGAPYQIIGKLVATENESMSWLGPDDMALWNVDMLQ